MKNYYPLSYTKDKRSMERNVSKNTQMESKCAPKILKIEYPALCGGAGVSSHLISAVCSESPTSSSIHRKEEEALIHFSVLSGSAGLCFRGLAALSWLQWQPRGSDQVQVQGESLLLVYSCRIGFKESESWFIFKFSAEEH